jgi:hypothetical protein
LPPLTIPEYIDSILNTWGSTLKQLIELLVAIGAATGILYGVVKWMKKRKYSQPTTKNKDRNHPIQ